MPIPVTPPVSSPPAPRPPAHGGRHGDPTKVVSGATWQDDFSDRF